MEVSNRTLSVILVLAIIFSLGGTIISLNRIAGIQTDVTSITGLAQGNATGLANLTISEVTEIVLDVSTIDFGSGYVANNSIFCNLSTVSQSNASTSPCLGFYNTTIPDALHLRNAGNKNVSVTLYINNNTNTWFNCGSGQGCGDGDAVIAINVSNNVTQACGSINTSFQNWGMFGNWTNHADPRENVLFYPDQTFTRICGAEGDPDGLGLDYTTGKNIIDIDVYIAMWLNATGNSQGEKRITFTFVGDST